MSDILTKQEETQEKQNKEMSFQILQREINQLFNNWLSTRSSETELSFVPAIDVKDDKNAINIFAELPGLDEKNFNIILNDDSLIIQGEKKQEYEQTGKGFFHKESSSGTFRRRIDFPEKIDQAGSQAEFYNGILKIKLAKKTAEKGQ